MELAILILIKRNEYLTREIEDGYSPWSLQAMYQANIQLAMAGRQILMNNTDWGPSSMRFSNDPRGYSWMAPSGVWTVIIIFIG